MTSFIAACGSGRSTSFIPAVPAAWSVTMIAFMGIFSSVIFLFGGNVAGMESPFDISCQGPWVVSQVALGGADRMQPARSDGAGRPRASMGARLLARSFLLRFARNQLGDEMLELARQRLRQHRHILGVQ